MREIEAMFSLGLYIQTKDNVLCDAHMFTLDMSSPNGKAAYGAALAAMLAKKQVQIEISNATGCQGWGTALQSIIVLDQ